MAVKTLNLESRLARERSRLFVGRDAEKDLFTRLVAPQGDLRVLCFHGAGGVGKSTLIIELQQIMQARGLASIRVDGRGVMPAPQALQAAVDEARATAGVAATDPHVLFIDTFELLAALEGWLREEWLPAQSDHLRVVIAGRQPPSLTWRTDPGWSQALVHQPLPYLDRAQAETYLSRRKLRPDAIARGVDFARGHPLALALYADAAKTAGSDLPPSPDLLLSQMVGRVLDNVETAASRLTIYASAIVRSLNESLLTAMLAQPAADQIDWLRGLSFMEQGARGLFPHDLVREALLADLKQRDLELYQQLGQRAFNWSLARIEAREGDLVAHGLDLFFLLREMQPPPQEGDEALYLDVAGDADWPQIDSMLLQHENPESVEMLHRLFQAQPQALRVIRNAGQAVTGFMLLLTLNDLPDELLQQDSVSAGFWRQCSAGAQGRVSLLRFWMHREAYMDLSPVHALVFTALMLDSLHPQQAYGGLLQLDTAYWADMAQIIGHQRLEGSEQSMPAGDAVLVYQDFTRRSAVEWLRGIYNRFQGLNPGAAPPPHPIVNGTLQDNYVRDVRRALKHYPRADLLAGNPLLQSRQVRERATNDAPAGRITALRAMIDNACAELAANPRTQPHARALMHGYLTPAANQHLAADAANMAYSTFRRHLAEGVRMVAAQLRMDE